MMSKLQFLAYFSLISILAFGQVTPSVTDSVQQKKEAQIKLLEKQNKKETEAKLLTKEKKTLAKQTVSDTIKVDSLTSKKTWKFNAFVGVDLYQPILTAFSDKTSFLAYLQLPVYKNWDAVIELGQESLSFRSLGWDVDASGIYAKLGGNWFFTKAAQEPNSGFYTGIRLGYSTFNQDVNDYPIVGLNSNEEVSINSGGSLGNEGGSAFWLEPVVGGRVKLFNTNFYADTSVRLQILVNDSNGHEIESLAIPGYGKDNGNFNGTIQWGIGYKF